MMGRRTVRVHCGTVESAPRMSHFDRRMLEEHGQQRVNEIPDGLVVHEMVCEKDDRALRPSRYLAREGGEQRFGVAQGARPAPVDRVEGGIDPVQTWDRRAWDRRQAAITEIRQRGCEGRRNTVPGRHEDREKTRGRHTLPRDPETCGRICDEIGKGAIGTELRGFGSRRRVIPVCEAVDRDAYIRRRVEASAEAGLDARRYGG